MVGAERAAMEVADWSGSSLIGDENDDEGRGWEYLLLPLWFSRVLLLPFACIVVCARYCCASYWVHNKNHDSHGKVG